MNKLIKALEAIGQSESIYQSKNITESLNVDELSQLETCANELYCIHAPGDDDQD